MSTIEYETLETHFSNAWQWLQQTGINTHLGERTANHLPWFLVIGPRNAGKTHLILQSGLKRFQQQQFAIDPKDEDSNYKHCNWWLTQEALFLDIPGHYFEHDKNKINWQHLTEILQKYIRRKNFHGIILTLDATEWSSQNKNTQQNLIQQLKHSLHILTKYLKHPCPLHLVFTKLDKVAGFGEFFSDLGKEERERTWGFPIPTSSNLPNTFKAQYDRILKRLNERIILRLHQERNAEKRILIQQFPAQIEILKSNLTNFIYQFADSLSHYSKTPLQGIYFVSNLQQGMPVNLVQNHLTQTLDIPLPAQDISLIPQPKYQQAYFSQQLFKKIIFNNIHAISSKFNLAQQSKTRLTAYAICALALMGSCLFMGHSFNKKIKAINAAQAAITQYRLIAQQLPVGNHDLNQSLPALNSIKHAVDLVKQAQIPWLMAQGFRQPSTQFLAEQSYQRALINYFLPGLSYSLEQTLTTETDPNVLYNTLKIYLMLSQPNRLDSSFTKQWLNSYWQQTLYANPALQNQLNTHLSALLARPITPIVPNQQVIAKARETLKTIPANQLSYAILKSNYISEWINPFLSDKKQAPALTQVFSNIAKIPGIPKFYTAELFSAVFFQQIPNTCLIVTNGDWVLGKAPRSDNLQLLTQTVQSFYLQDYAKHWQTLLNSLTINQAQNPEEFAVALKELASKDSPFIALIKTVQQNTSLTKLAPFITNATETETQIIKTNLSDPFSAVNNLLLSINSLKTSNIDNIIFNIKQLQNYLEPVTNSNDAQAAFDLAKKRFTNTADTDPIRALLAQAKDMPSPMQSWLNALANNSWYLILNETKQYLNQTWKTEVLNEYNKKINNRYPLFKHSETDVTLANFKNFFAPQGIVDSYFKNYLAPFINTSQADWRSRTIDGLSLNFSSNLLAQLERAGIIRAMFFNSNQQLNVDFYLRRVALGPNVKRFALIYNDQPYVENTLPQTYRLSWPTKTESITLAFTNEENHAVTQTINGPWALFHLLDKAQLHPTKDTRHFELVFDANGYAARYQIATDQMVNPFISGIVDQFRAPESLN